MYGSLHTSNEVIFNKRYVFFHALTNKKLVEFQRVFWLVFIFMKVECCK